MPREGRHCHLAGCTVAGLAGLSCNYWTEFAENFNLCKGHRNGGVRPSTRASATAATPTSRGKSFESGPTARGRSSGFRRPALAAVAGVNARSSVRGWLLLALVAVVVQQALTLYPQPHL